MRAVAKMVAEFQHQESSEVVQVTDEIDLNKLCRLNPGKALSDVQRLAEAMQTQSDKCFEY